MRVLARLGGDDSLLVIEIVSADYYPANQEMHLYAGPDNVFNIKPIANADARRHIIRLFSEGKTDLSAYDGEWSEQI